MSAATSVGSEPPPQHVRAAFGVGGGEVLRLAGTSTWRCGDVVLKPVTDRPFAVWLARTLGEIEEPDLRIARPVRSTDGRTLIAGWRACRYVAGAPQPWGNEVVVTAVKLHRATAGLPRPDYRRDQADVSAIADRVAWGEQEISLDEAKGGRWFEVLAGARQPVSLPDQLVHADLFGRVLFDEEEPAAAPGIVDFRPYFRPGEWGAAVAAVDALAWGDAEPDLLRRWAHLPEWPQLLLRAVLFRLASHALNQRSTRAALDGLRFAAHEVSELL